MVSGRGSSVFVWLRERSIVREHLYCDRLFANGIDSDRAAATVHARSGSTLFVLVWEG